MTVPTPPVLTGQPAVDAELLSDWGWQLYRALVIEGRLIQRNVLIAAIPQLPGTATSAEIIATVNAIIVAAGA